MNEIFKCASCGVELIDHLGLEGTCELKNNWEQQAIHYCNKNELLQSENTSLRQKVEELEKIATDYETVSQRNEKLRLENLDYDYELTGVRCENSVLKSQVDGLRKKVEELEKAWEWFFDQVADCIAHSGGGGDEDFYVQSEGWPDIEPKFQGFGKTPSEAVLKAYRATSRRNNL